MLQPGFELTVELHLLEGPFKDALPSELHCHGNSPLIKMPTNIIFWLESLKFCQYLRMRACVSVRECECVCVGASVSECGGCLRSIGLWV